MPLPAVKPFSIKVFFADGEPRGLRLVEKSGWNGFGAVCPRQRFGEVKNRGEFGGPGVYLLLGDDAGQNLPDVYVGEADPLVDRITHYIQNKDFWERFVAFSDRGQSLNKAHIQYLEHRMIQTAGEAKRCNLLNGNTPTAPSLSEADRADCELFLDEVFSISSALGITVFEKPEIKTSQQRLLFLKYKEIEAKGYETADGFVVLKGSEVFPETTPSAPSSIIQLRSELLAKGVFGKNEKGGLAFLQDYEFSSPSTAAGIIRGASSNGRSEWRTGEGKKLREIQDEQMPSG
jgi:Domain of unknown function (DUF4357)